MSNARATDPDTSQEAGADTDGRRAIRYTLLDAYAITLIYEGRGLTDEEVMEVCGFDMADDGHRRRCSDLRRDGLITQIVVDGEPVTRRSDRTGMRRMVCTITEAGIDLMKTILA